MNRVLQARMRASTEEKAKADSTETPVPDPAGRGPRPLRADERCPLRYYPLFPLASRRRPPIRYY
jgi:hypothetical protein